MTPMYRLFFLVIMLAGLAGAATIVNTTVTCDGVTTSALRCQGTGPFTLALVQVESPIYVSANAGADQGHSASASVFLHADVLITIISGPATGSFFPCFDVGIDHFQGNASASASLGQFSFSSSGNQGISGNCSNSVPKPGQPYTLGVTEILPLSMSASASAGSKVANSAQAGGDARVSSLLVFDSDGNLVTNAVYTLREAPEPAPAVLVFCGALLLFIARRRFARIVGAAK